MNMLFIQTSNEGGDFRGGALAGLLGPVYTVLVGGMLGLGFLVWSRKKFRSFIPSTRSQTSHHKKRPLVPDQCLLGLPWLQAITGDMADGDTRISMTAAVGVLLKSDRAS